MGTSRSGSKRTPERVPCSVPYCRRTKKRERPDEEWLCDKHWPLGSPAWRRRYARVRRAHRKRQSSRTFYLAFLMWQRLKRQVVERAVAIGPGGNGHRR